MRPSLLSCVARCIQGQAEPAGLIDPASPQPYNMQTFGKTYKEPAESASLIPGLLEVIESDFANLESDTVDAETVGA